MSSAEQKARIASSFGARANTYDGTAKLQRDIADLLATHLPDMYWPRVLEIGAGTGFLTRHLFARYPQGRHLITDIAPEMVDACRRNHPHAAAQFAVMDGESPSVEGGFDLIASSMAVQWFDDPHSGLERLRAFLNPEGMVLYAALGHESFGEWDECVRETGLMSGLTARHELSGVFAESRIAVKYDNARAFLKALRDPGSGTPRPGYKSQSFSLRRACRLLEERYGAEVTWHVVYGALHLS